VEIKVIEIFDFNVSIFEFFIILNIQPVFISKGLSPILEKNIFGITPLSGVKYVNLNPLTLINVENMMREYL